MKFKFEALKVWQKSLDLTVLVRRVAKDFPREERYVLAAQFARAADSVSLNIAEGSTGQSNAEFNRFLRIALRSNIEVVGCIWIAKRNNMITQENFDLVYDLCEEILLMINALGKFLKQ